MNKRNNFSPGDLADKELSSASKDPYTRLMAGIIAQAARDAKEGDRSAEQWLASEVCQSMLEILDIDRNKVLGWLSGSREYKQGGDQTPTRRKKNISNQLSFIQWKPMFNSTGG